MEKKTTGAFIAALRKANGLTQKELADKLNISDKSVSRWERDECSPDLSLIPVIADIFGVTCDELLRGERSHAENQSPTNDDILSKKSEKQVLSYYKKSLAAFCNLGIISVGIAVLGLLVALMCNYAFNLPKTMLGFLLGVSLVAIAYIIVIVGGNIIYSKNEAEDDWMELFQTFKNRFAMQRYKSLVIITVILAFIMPFGFNDGSFDIWLFGGLIFKGRFFGGLLFALVVLVAAYFIYIFAWCKKLRTEKDILPEKEAKLLFIKRMVWIRVFLVFIPITLILIVWTVIYSLNWKDMCTNYYVFADYDEFEAFMKKKDLYDTAEPNYLLIQDGENLCPYNSDFELQDYELNENAEPINISAMYVNWTLNKYLYYGTSGLWVMVGIGLIIYYQTIKKRKCSEL